MLYKGKVASKYREQRASVLDVPLFPTLESTIKCHHGDITSCQTQTLGVVVLMHQTLNYDRHKKSLPISLMY